MYSTAARRVRTMVQPFVTTRTKIVSMTADWQLTRRAKDRAPGRYFGRHFLNVCSSRSRMKLTNHTVLGVARGRRNISEHIRQY
jgi:hypothetical protein